MRLASDIMVRLHRGEITPAQAFAEQARRRLHASLPLPAPVGPSWIAAYIPYSPVGDLGAEYNRIIARLDPGEWALFLDHDAMALTNDVWDDLLEAIRLHPDAGAFVCWTNRTGNPAQQAPDCPPDDDIARHTAWAADLRARAGFHLTDVTGDQLTGVWFATSRSAWERAGGFAHGFGGVDNAYAKALRQAGLRTYRLDGTYIYHQRRTNGWNRQGAAPVQGDLDCRKAAWAWRRLGPIMRDHATGILADLYAAHARAIEERPDFTPCQKAARRRHLIRYWRDSMRISVCIPARREPPEELVRTVNSFRKGGADEILVTDDGSTDHPVRDDCGADRILRHPLPIGVAASRNELLAAATGNVIAYSDAHCHIVDPSDLLAWAAQAYTSEALHCAVCGSYDNPDAWYYGFAYRWIGACFDLTANRAPTERPAGPFGSVYAAARWTWNRLGGWLPTRGYGYNEQSLGFVCHLTDTPILVDPSFRIRHQFRTGKQFRYEQPDGTTFLANQILAHRLIFGDDLFRSIFLPAAQAKRYTRAIALATEWLDADSGALPARYEALRRISPEDILRRIGAASLIPAEPPRTNA